jgi:hypothetical protein
MASTPKLPLAALAAFALPCDATAQQLSAHVSTSITIAVRPTLTIRGITPARIQVDSAGHVNSSAIVHVESNLAYRLSVRIAPAANRSARVLVRRADGAFQHLVTGESITTAVSRSRGPQSHEVVCRIATPESDGCPLVYELSAEHADVLIRTMAVDSGLRAADTNHNGLRTADYGLKPARDATSCDASVPRV